MPVRNYGVLKGRAIDRVIEYESHSPHYQIHVQAGATDYRIAVNVKSTDDSTPELLFYVAENFQHVVTDEIAELEEGFHYLQRKPDGMALDYIRSNLFSRSKMVVLPHNIPGEDNDLNEKVEMYVRRAVRHEDAIVYAFGSRWGPENRTKDKIFGFKPGNGVHNIHMNQGNPRGRHAKDNGVYQDGALLIHYPSQSRWVGIFLAFQSQAWHTGNRNGHPDGGIDEYGPAYEPSPQEPDRSIHIVAAMVNPPGGDPGKETVTLLNITDTPIDLRGWKLMDRGKRKMNLSGMILPNAPLTIKLSRVVQLSNSGGIITLLNPSGLKVDGVHYTKKMAHEQGRVLVF